ncbi:MAG TPA: COX15/CtaA family protein [Actinomycetota bacterium]|nr:COX15/CtaA family protein [Actinomycetota bacterium]
MSSFRKLATLSTVATIILVAIGGLVRATKSGLGCGTDWPHCSGKLVPALETRAELIEFSHRAAASVVVVLLAALAVTAFRERRDRPFLLWPSIGAFGLVMFQALLGAVVVKLELEAESVVLHLATAMSLLALLIYIVGLAAASEGAMSDPPDRSRSVEARWAAGAVLFLLLVGSFVSGFEGAGRAFNDWPLMNGSLVPDLSVEENAVHFFHRAVAGIVGVILVVTLLKVIREKTVRPLAARFAHLALGLFAVEVLVGALNVWTDLNSAAVSVHLLLGALIWASACGVAVATAPRLRERAAMVGSRAFQMPAEQGS